MTSEMTNQSAVSSASAPPRRNGGMLAIDTNLIVRYLVGDDLGQAARARRLIDNNDVFVCTTVLLETEWVLRSVHGFSAAQCAKALSEISRGCRA
jgi:predicted nucleic acid-binding protein